MDNSNIPKNPYIIGRPIFEEKMFFGRQSLFHFLENHLQNGVKIILLHGQRCIGKSSVLSQIPRFVPQNEFKFVSFDLQGKSQSSLSDVLQSLALQILKSLEIDEHKITPPTVEQLETELDIFFRNFLSAVYQELEHKNLVLLLDEFDIESNYNTYCAAERFFPYVKFLIEQQDKLFVVPILGRQLDDLPKLREIFQEYPYYEIGLLDEISARLLITQPTEGVLQYEEDALKTILELSAGHPYFTQIICFTIFEQAREENNWLVTHTEVEKVVDKVIEIAEEKLTWLWDGLPIPEQVIFSTVAEAQNIASSQGELSIQGPLTLLKKHGVVQTEQLIQARKRLIERGFLDDLGCSMKVELISLWLVKRYPVQREIRELENLDSEAHDLYQLASKLRQQGEKQKALKLYQQTLDFNPNYFSALFAIAEGYLEAENFRKAVTSYKRAYKVDPIYTQEGYVKSLLGYGHKLIEQGELTQAQNQFNRVLKIEPINVIALEKLQKIEENKEEYSNDSSIKDKPRVILLGATATALIIAIFMSIGYYLGSNLCTIGQTRINGKCVVNNGNKNKQIPTEQREPERFSSGERPIFPASLNANRNLGIEAFKKGDYSQAADFFKKAVIADRSDPELLIYYNNALARKQGSPFTLAAVVSVGNSQDSDREILRGVAQAQNQFNASKGLNNQLLEIVIANDSNQPEKSQKIAQELIKDKSVLGVIGHNSSDATNAALPEYEKAGLATISPISTSTSLTASGEVLFRIASTDYDAGNKLAEYVKNKLRVDKVVIFHNAENTYSNSLKDAFTNNFQKVGGNVVRKIDLNNPNMNAEAEVRRSRFADKASVALLFPDKKLIAQSIKIAKANAPLPKDKRLKLLGGDALYTGTTLSAGGEAIDGLILAVPWFAKLPQSENFSSSANKQWGGQPSWRTATSFDATQAFIKVLSNDASRFTVLQKLRSVEISARETSGNALKFNQQRENEKAEPVLVQVVKSKPGFQKSGVDFGLLKSKNNK